MGKTLVNHQNVRLLLRASSLSHSLLNGDEPCLASTAFCVRRFIWEASHRNHHRVWPLSPRENESQVPQKAEENRSLMVHKT